MITALKFAGCISAILAVVLAVAPNVPLLHLLAAPAVGSGLLYHGAGLAVVVLLAVGIGAHQGFAGPVIVTVAWMVALGIAWWWVGWNLWARR